MSFTALKITALAGGVGGARLVEGLAALLPPTQLRVIVNTGDDFEHWGLTICPDLDTVMYTLSGRANPETGWGLVGETFHCLEAVTQLGGPAWFRLGDRDLATHLLRTEWLRAGQRLTAVTHRLATALGVEVPLLPMTDQPFRTQVLTDEGVLPFQEYFVRRRWQPIVRGFFWEGAATAQPTPEVLESLAWANLIVLCPSNPFVSIGPILALPGVREAISQRITLAISPILGGQAVKGPAAKMFQELGITPSATAVAAHYGPLLTGFILDITDAALEPEIRALGMIPRVVPTLMPHHAARVALAQEVLTFGLQLR